MLSGGATNPNCIVFGLISNPRSTALEANTLTIKPPIRLHTIVEITQVRLKRSKITTRTLNKGQMRVKPCGPI